MNIIVMVIVLIVVIIAIGGGYYWFMKEPRLEIEERIIEEGNEEDELCSEFYTKDMNTGECVLNEKQFYKSFGKLVGHYTIDNFDQTNNKWNDAVLSGSGFKTDGKFVSGTIESKVEFPSTILPETYTLIHVAKYNGPNKGRILQGKTKNWLSGFHGGDIGAAYQQGWIVGKSDISEDMPLLSVDQKGFYRANGMNRVDNIIDGTSDNIVINTGYYADQKSDWAIGEILVYDSKLTIDQIKELEEHLSKKYDISLESTTESFSNIKYPKNYAFF